MLLPVTHQAYTCALLIHCVEGAHEVNKHATIRKISDDFHTLTDTSKYYI